MATTDKPALADSTNAPPPPAAKHPPRPAADKPPQAVVTWYHPDQLPPPPAAELLRPAPPAAAPKESSSAFVFFGRATRDDIKAAHPDWSLGDVGRELGKRWKALDDAAKKPFRELAAADKERYESEKTAYDAANQPPPVVAAKSAPPASAPRKSKKKKRRAPVLVEQPLPETKDWEPDNDGVEYVDALTGLPPPPKKKKQKKKKAKVADSEDKLVANTKKKKKGKGGARATGEFAGCGRGANNRNKNWGRGANTVYSIDEYLTKKHIPRLQKWLKEHPDGGDAMAEKVAAGWGAFKGTHRNVYYVDLDANKCYQTRPKLLKALTAQASA